MKYRTLAGTGISVSNLALGTMGYGTETDEAAAFTILDAFVEADGNLVGRIRVSGTFTDVTFEPAGTENEAAIDAAYEAKYPGSSAIPIMQGAGPKSASVRISPR